MGRIRSIFVGLCSMALIVSSQVVASGAGAPSALAPASPVTMTTLTPDALVDGAGTHAGDVTALATRDQRRTQDDPSRYVRFRGAGAAYQGYASYTLPPGVDPAQITTISLIANLRGPTAARNAWTFSIYDWNDDVWTRVGDQRHCGGDEGTRQWPCDDLDRRPWKKVQWNVIVGGGTALSAFVRPTTRELRVRLSAGRAGSARLDAEALEVFSNDGSTDVALWTPALGLRWQWQLEGRDGQHEASGGIAVGICSPPFGGGACVRPDVFDIDLYVDPQIAGRYGWVRATDAVDAIHTTGRQVIGYLTQGDAERWRPDYQQFVDFDERCHGCLLGRPFSRRFPDEYWANFSNGRGRMRFMLQMMRARTDRVAATGFDGIEYDIADTYAQGRDTTGFRVRAATQLAYNTALTQMAHEDGLAVALKNDLGQVEELQPSYDLAINEQCFQYHECGVYRAFTDAGKPVLEAEYRIAPERFCDQAIAGSISAIAKARNYSLYAHPWTPCA
jgi:endo-alpha-1,4-polygalactosaminidase (GH114 family)